jgi:hypothetical protein
MVRAGARRRPRDFYFRWRSCFVIHSTMFLRCVVWIICLAGWSAWAQAQPQTFKLVDGSIITGRLVAPQDKYLQVALEGGGSTPIYTNVLWARLSQETLQELTANRAAAPFARIFLDPPAEERAAPTPRKISIKTPPRLERPQGGSLFASPVMLVVLLLIYVANIYAGWEIGVYRQWPPAMTAAVAAFLPIIGPAIFLAMPTHRPKVEEFVETAPVEEAPVVVEEAPAAPVVEQPVKPAIPETVVYPRGQFTFNRRFFETKFAGFLKMVPGEAERDKLIVIKSARGEHVGHRFSKVEPNEVFLQVRKGNATEDVMIPFSDIFEVQVKHKDA